MNRTVIGIFAGLTFLYSILVIAFALNGYPGFRQDAECFLPTSYYINHYHQLINPLYDAGIDTVKHRFLFYPPLFPYVVAFITNLIPLQDNKIELALTFIDLLSIIITLLSAYLYIKKNIIKSKIAFLLYPFLVVWVIALFSFHGIVDGRPETLSTFFISCFILNNIYFYKNNFNFINGLLIGLNAITSPISTFYLIIITIGLLTYRNNFKIKPIAQTILGVTLVSVFFVLLYPYHLIDLVHGLAKHSSNAVFNREGANRIMYFIGFYVLSLDHPLVIITFLISIGYAFYLIIKKRKYETIAIFFLLLVTVSYFSFKDMFMAYNLFVLSSFFIFLLLVFFVDILNGKFLTDFTKTSFVFLSILLFLNAGVLFRTTLVFFSTQDKKISYRDFKKDLDVLTKKIKKNNKIRITFSLWPYCLDKTSYIANSLSEDSPVQFIILQQSNSGQSQPKQIQGYRLIKNGFIPDHPMFGKFQIGNTYPWYQTAIYERK